MTVNGTNTLTATVSNVERKDKMKNIAENAFDVIHGIRQAETHLLDLMSKFIKTDGVTMIHIGYTADGIMADIHYSLDHKNYVVTIQKKDK